MTGIPRCWNQQSDIAESIEIGSGNQGTWKRASPQGQPHELLTLPARDLQYKRDAQIFPRKDPSHIVHAPASPNSCRQSAMSKTRRMRHPPQSSQTNHKGHIHHPSSIRFAPRHKAKARGKRPGAPWLQVRLPACGTSNISPSNKDQVLCTKQSWKRTKGGCHIAMEKRKEKRNGRYERRRPHTIGLQFAFLRGCLLSPHK